MTREASQGIRKADEGIVALVHATNPAMTSLPPVCT
jgi:hypothetical protein